MTARRDVMRRFAVAAAASLLFGAVALEVSAGAPPEPPIVHVTTRSGEGLWSVATRLCPNAVGTAYAALQQLNPWVVGTGLDPGTVLHWDPTLCPTPTTTTSTSTSSLPPSSTAAPTTVPSTSTTVTVTTSPSSSTTTSTVTTSSTTTTAPSTTSVPTSSTPPTTVPPGGFPTAPIADIPSNFSTGQYLHSQTIPASTADQPTGNFRTLCRPSHYAHHDPIVNPGGTSAHLHLFFGNTAVNNYSTYQTLRTSGGSTCEGGPLNRTGYWMPAVFDGSGRVVPPDTIVVYYKATASGGGWTFAQLQADVRNTQPLPNGLRMIAGGVGYGHMQWKCGDNSNIGTTIPTNCPMPQPGASFLIGIVDFPECWDGVNLDSPNHRSHMAYRSYVNGRLVCPSTHPVHIPTITENFQWNVGATDVGTWYLSSDMGAPRGSTLHADWFGAWDNPVMNRWFTSCLIGMRNSDNGNLCDGQQLSSSAYTGAITSPARLTGYIPNAPQ